MADPTPLAQLQQTICTHLRDPQRAPAPSQIPLQRLALYRELVRTNFVEQLGGAFPVLQQSCDDDYWERLLDDFLADHRCRSPLFHQLPQEFVDYLQHERTAPAGDPPWLAELAHYEWMELALAQHEAELPPADTPGDPLRRGFRLSPLARPLSYRFAVHRIGPHYRPQQPEPEPTHLLVYRDRGDQVQFMAINVMTAHLLQLIATEEQLSGAALLRQIAAELQHPQPQQLLMDGSALLQQLNRQAILL